MEKKKNNMNFYLTNNEILDIDELDRHQLTIGKYNNFIISNSDDDRQFEQQHYTKSKSYKTFDNLYEYEDDTIFNKVKSNFNHLNVIHVPMSYYPFNSYSIEMNYENTIDINYYNLLTCPACYNAFQHKVYVMDNKVILCSKCYNNENIIKFI